MTMQIETGHAPHGGAVPVWARIVGALGALWYGFGLLQMWLGVTLDTTAAVASGAMSVAQAAAVDQTPALVWLAFALASGAGLVGAAFVWGARWSAAAAFFKLSLLMASLYYAWVYLISGTGAARPSEELVIAGVVLGVTAVFALIATRLSR